MGVMAAFNCSCGMIEDSQDIPDPGVYQLVGGSEGYVSKLVIEKLDKGYTITMLEYVTGITEEICRIEASGKKSSYGIWVEIPAYGPRLSVVIRKINKGDLVISIKGQDDPTEVFKYCLSDRSPIGIYQRLQEG